MTTDPTPADIEAARDALYSDGVAGMPDRVARALATARAEADAAGYARGRADGLTEALIACVDEDRAYCARHGGGGDYCRGIAAVADRIRALREPTPTPDPWTPALPPQVYAPEVTPGPRVGGGGS